MPVLWASGGLLERCFRTPSISGADALILDEATSALDGIAEKLIMGAILDFSGQ